jgi:hypothetical protein
MSPDLLELRSEVERLREQWQAEQAENEIRQALAKARELLAGQPAQAVTQLEALGRKHAGRGDIEGALREAREAVISLKERTEQQRAAEAIQAAAKSADRPKQALGKLEKLPEPLRSRPEVQAAIQEYRERLQPRVAPAPAGASAGVRAPEVRAAEVPSAEVPDKSKFPLSWVFAAAALVAIAGVGAWVLTHRTTTPEVTLLPVEIRTDPTGVTVSVGDRSCQTPNCQLQLPPGSYQVSAKRDGYEPALQALTIQAGKRPDPVSMTLKPVAVVVAAGRPVGTLVISTGTPDVLVLIDNTPAGRTGTDGTFREPIEAAAHTVRVEKQGFEVVAEKRVTIANGQTAQVAFTLAPQSARLELQGAPAGVEISANGASLGRTTGGPFSARVPPGLRTLRMAAGSSSHEVARSFEPGQTVTLDWASIAPPVTTTTGGTVKVDPAETEWAAVRDASDPALVQSYLDKYPNSAHVAEAQSRIESLTWSRTNQNDAQALRAYVTRFPSGPHAREATARIAELADQIEKQNQAKAQAQAKEAAERLAQEKAAQQLKEQAAAQAAAAAAAAAAKGKENAVVQQRNQEIKTALDQFNLAFEHKSQRELRAIWVKPVQDYLDAMTQSGQNSFLMVLRPTADAVVTNNTATVLCELTTRTTFRGQVRPPNQTTVKVSLANAGGRWQILEIGKP